LHSGFFVSADRESPFIDRCESPPTFLLDLGDNGTLTWEPPLFHDNSGKPLKVILINYVLLSQNIVLNWT